MASQYFQGKFSALTSQSCTFDTSPPTFAGITGATPNSDGSITVNWALASSPKNPVDYHVYIAQGNVSAASLFQVANQAIHIPAGKSTGRVFLMPDETTYLVKDQVYTIGVRANDALGYEDSNTALQVVTAIASGNLPAILQSLATQAATTQSAFATTQASFAAGLTTFSGYLASLNTYVNTNLADALTALGGHLTTLNGYLGTLNTYVNTNLSAALSTLSGYLTTFSGYLSGLNTVGGSLASSASSISTSASALDAEITDLSNQLSELADISADVASSSGGLQSALLPSGLKGVVHQPAEVRGTIPSQPRELRAPLLPI